MYPSTANPTPVVHHNRGYGYSVAGATGTMAAALAQNSLVFTLMCGAQAGIATAQDRLSMFIDRLRLAFTTIAAFTTPVTAGRQLGVYRATNPGALQSGGTALAVVAKDSNATAPATPASVVSDVRIATTVGLTAGGLVREANPIALLDLASFGAAGGRAELVYELNAPANHEIVLNPGDILVVSNPVAMDAVGSWQLSVNECHWTEAKRFLK